MNTATAATAHAIDRISLPARGPEHPGVRPWLPYLAVRAGDVMTTPVTPIDARASIWEAARRLVGEREAHLVVVDGTRPVGILNEAVLALQWPCGPLSAYRQEVQNLTSNRVHTVLPQVAVSKVAEIMLADAVAAVPVVTRRGVVIGLVTTRNMIELIARLSASPSPLDRAADCPATPDPDSVPDLVARPQGGTPCGTSPSARR